MGIFQIIHFTVRYQHATFVNITTNLYIPVADTFSKILIFTGKLKPYHWQQILPVVFLERLLYIYISSVNNQFVGCSFVKVLSKNKSPQAKWLVQLVTHTTSPVLFLEITTIPQDKEMLYADFPLHPQNSEKTHTQGSRVNKISNFCCFIKDILKWKPN